MAILAAIWRIASITIPLPIAVLVAIGVWWQVDKHSAVRKAVAEYVAADQLAAERANNKAAAILTDEVKRQNETLLTANRTFQDAVHVAHKQSTELAQEVDELKGKAVNTACLVDPALFGRLRTK